MAQTKVKLIADDVIVQSNLNASHGITTADIGENASYLYYTDARVSSYLSTNGYATQTDIVAAITDSAPVTLDTLNELAAALGDDPNFATTTATSLGLKAPLASPSFTGNVGIGVTPSSWQTIQNSNALQFYGSYVYNYRDTNLIIGNNAYYDGAWKYYKSSIGATKFNSGNGAFDFAVSSSGTANNPITWIDALIIDSSGLVKINTTDANARFRVNETRSNEWVAGFKHTGTNAYGLFINTADNTGVYNLGCYTNTGTGFFVKNDGNVGIGTDSPTTTLSVKGTSSNGINVIGVGTTASRVFAGLNASNHGYLFVTGSSGQSPSLINSAGGDSYISGGNVGIGTDSPDEPLHLSQAAANTFFKMEAYASTQGADAGINVAREQVTGSDSNLSFWTNTGSALTQKMAVKSDGNVGIGTTTFAPTPNLQLKIGNMGSGIVGEIFDAADNADNSRIIVCGGGIGTPQFSMRHYSAGYGIDMWLNTSSPWDTYIDNRNAASGFIFRNNCNNDGGEDELIRITGSGNVGISTTSPSSKLELGPNGSLGANITNKNVILNVDGGYGTTGTPTSGQYKVIGFIGTTKDVTDITGQTSGEVLKNFYLGMIGGDYFNVNRFSFWQGGSERLTIQGYGANAGNVGIGTPSPDFALDIEAVSSGVQLQMGRTTTSAGSTWMGSDSNGFHLGVGAYGAGNSVADPNGFTVLTSGNVGIGETNPSSKLHVVGGATNSQHIIRGPYTVGISGTGVGSSTLSFAYNFNGLFNTGYIIEVYAVFNHWNSGSANYTYCYRKGVIMGYGAAAASEILGPGGGVSDSVNVGAWTFIVDNNGPTGYAQRILINKSAGNAAWNGTYWVQIVCSVPLDPTDVS
jgi:hypothetical protein